MSDLLKHLSIKNKLILAIFGAASLVSLAGFVFDVSVDTKKLHQEMIENVKSEMRVLSQDFVKIALFADIHLAADAVAKLRAFPLIHNVYLYKNDGEVVFSYESAPTFSMEPPPLADLPPRYDQGFLRLFLPVEYAGSQYGHVFVRVSTEALEKRLNEYYKIIAASVPVLLLVSYLLALWLQHYFSGPILALTAQVNRIAENREFDERITSNESNEIGSLCHSFNQLLETIEESQARLQHGEARLAAIINIVGSGIVSIDEEYRITLFNHQSELMFGYAAHEVIGQPVGMLLPERFREQHDEKIAQFIHSDAYSRSSVNLPEARALRKNGEEFPVELSVSQLEIGGPRIVIVAINDVSSRRKTENEHQEYRAHLERIVDQRTSELQAKSRDLEDFSYSVTHDLRAPLRAISGFAQAVLDDAGHKLNDEERGNLNRVIKAGDNLMERTDDILNLLRIGRSQHVLAEVDLSAMVGQLSRQIANAEPQRVVRWEIQPGMVVRADPQSLEIMLDHLLSNAWKFTRKERVASIAVGDVDLNGRHVYFVKDNGVGFDMQYENKLFGLFQRLHPGGEFEGSGVGLATVQRIVQRHGGEVWAEADVNQGATFFFTLS
jgi:PAS domain S-box-containing protein